jgi:8-oxo-dGTP diphosphatase
LIREFSAGGVLFRDGYVLLIKTPSGVWSFPKGLVESGEKPEETAVREVFEETGVQGRPLTPLGEVSYWYVRDGQKVKKRVAYYLMAYEGGEPKPSWEVLDAKFFSVEQAKRLLKYPGDKEVFKKALELISHQDNVS